MSVTAETVRHRTSSFLLGGIAGAAVMASLFVVGIVGWRWVDSAFSSLELTEGEVQMRTLNEFLETRSIPAGLLVVVDAEEGDNCTRWVATVELYRRNDQAIGPDRRREPVDAATFLVYEDSGDPFPEERPEMSGDQVMSELCE